jgi:hypothetical protein
MELALLANPLIKRDHQPSGCQHVVFILSVGRAGEGEDDVGLDLTNGAGGTRSPQKLRLESGKFSGGFSFFIREIFWNFHFEKKKGRFRALKKI